MQAELIEGSKREKGWKKNKNNAAKTYWKNNEKKIGWRKERKKKKRIIGSVENEVEKGKWEEMKQPENKFKKKHKKNK